MTKAYDANIVLDTNVWIDFYLGERKGNKTSTELLTFASENNVTVAYPVTQIGNVFYLINLYFKSQIRKEKGEISEKDANIAKEFAWACINHLQENAFAIRADQSDVWLSCKYRTSHDDLEDNLALAAAERAKSMIFVTSDEKLLRHATVCAKTPKDALAMLKSKLS